MSSINFANVSAASFFSKTHLTYLVNIGSKFLRSAGFINLRAGSPIQKPVTLTFTYTRPMESHVDKVLKELKKFLISLKCSKISTLINHL